MPLSETWKALEDLVDEGIVKSIGVSNFSTQLLYDLQSYARHPVSSLQIEHHPYLVQDQLVKMAQEEGIAITAYSTFGPQSFLELSPAFSKRAEGTPLLFDHPVIQKITAAHGKTPGQVLLRWATQRYGNRMSSTSWTLLIFTGVLPLFPSPIIRADYSKIWMSLLST